MTTLARRQRYDPWKRDAIRFALVCFASFTLLAFAYFWLRSSPILEPFLAFNASLANHLVNLFGASAQVAGAVISSGDSSFRVIAECTSIIPTGVFVAMVLAWPCDTRRKAIGILLGSAAFFLINLVRIVSLFYIAQSFPGLLDIAHFYIWGFLTVFVIVAAWYLWARGTLQESPAPAYSRGKKRRGRPQR